MQPIGFFIFSQKFINPSNSKLKKLQSYKLDRKIKQKRANFHPYNSKEIKQCITYEKKGNIIKEIIFILFYFILTTKSGKG